jgi:hypothetical protein
MLDMLTSHGTRSGVARTIDISPSRPLQAALPQSRGPAVSSAIKSAVSRSSSMHWIFPGLGHMAAAPEQMASMRLK